MLNSAYEKEGGKGVVIPKGEFIKEHRHLLNVLTKGKPTDRLLEAQAQAKELKAKTGGRREVSYQRKEMGARLPLPPKSTLHLMAKASYQPNPPDRIGDFALVRNTPTIKLYRFQKTIVVAIRGTNPTDAVDLRADALIAVGQLENSARFKKDLQIINEETAKYPIRDYTWYGVGHSLGGAILDLLIEKGIIKEGISYNPAVQSQHYSNTGNKRIYNSNDPLYGIMGHKTTNKEVRQAPAESWWQKALNVIPAAKGLEYLYSKYKSHALDNFEGGTCWKQYEMVGMKEKNGRKVPNCVPKKGGAVAPVLMSEADWTKGKERFGVNKKTNHPMYKYATYADYKASFDKEDTVRKEQEQVKKEAEEQTQAIQKINAQKAPKPQPEAQWNKGHQRYPNDPNRPDYSYASYAEYKSAFEKRLADQKTDQLRRARKEFTPEEKANLERSKKLADEAAQRVAKEKEPTTCPESEKYSRRRAYDLDDTVCVEKPNQFGVKQATPVSYRELVGLDAKVRCTVPGRDDKYHYDTPDKCAAFSEDVIQKNVAHQEEYDNTFGATAARWGQNLAKTGISSLASAAANVGANALLPGSGFVASAVADYYVPKALDSIWDTRSGKDKYLEKIGVAPEYRDPVSGELIPAEPWGVRSQRIQDMVDGIDDIPPEKLGYDATLEDWDTHQEDYGKQEMKDRQEAAQASMYRGRGAAETPIERRLRLLLHHCKP